MNFDRLLTETEWSEILERVKKFDLFEFRKLDKTNRIELRIEARHCNNGLWQDDYICSVDGSKQYGDCHGFGSPYQRVDFLGLSYDDVLLKFGRAYGYKKAEVTQMNIFNLLGKGV
ncbi:MAG: hypothetical protein FWC00_01245 [Firmicutes bacterium]|nr:hypothetical protein [Bacillota bacterium]